MSCHVHHTHLFASSIDESVAFYRELFGGEVVLDTVLAGARNVFLRIGRGRLHLYAQAPTRPGPGSIHHLGIQTDSLDELSSRLASQGLALGKGIREAGLFRYLMVEGPDEVLIEAFEIDRSMLPPALSGWFE